MRGSNYNSFNQYHLFVKQIIFGNTETDQVWCGVIRRDQQLHGINPIPWFMKLSHCNNNLLISSAQVSTIRFSNARYKSRIIIIERQKNYFCFILKSNDARYHQ